jgi:hypothetical protein
MRRHEVREVELGGVPVGDGACEVERSWHEHGFRRDERDAHLRLGQIVEGEGGFEAGDASADDHDARRPDGCGRRHFRHSRGTARAAHRGRLLDFTP